MLCYSSLLFLLSLPSWPIKLPILFYLKKNGKRRSFPLARGHDGKSKRRGRLPFPFPLSPASWHKAWSQWKREEHRGCVDWIETFLMSPAPFTFSHIGRNFNRPPPLQKKQKNLSMPPLYIFAQSHNFTNFDFRDVTVLLTGLCRLQR